MLIEGSTILVTRIARDNEDMVIKLVMVSDSNVLYEGVEMIQFYICSNTFLLYFRLVRG